MNGKERNKELEARKTRFHEDGSFVTITKKPSNPSLRDLMPTEIKEV